MPQFHDCDIVLSFIIENMIYKGLDDDESKFLSMVYQQQAQQKAEKLQQEKEEILSFRISFTLIAHIIICNCSNFVICGKNPPN